MSDEDPVAAVDPTGATALLPLIESARPSIWGRLAIDGLQSVATLIVALVLWFVYQDSQEAKGVQSCRAALNADDARAAGQVILVVADSLLARTQEPRPDPAELTDRLAKAAAELEHTQEARQHMDELCD